jgi:hypothetical protein
MSNSDTTDVALCRDNAQEGLRVRTVCSILAAGKEIKCGLEQQVRTGTGKLLVRSAQTSKGEPSRHRPTAAVGGTPGQGHRHVAGAIQEAFRLALSATDEADERMGNVH